MRRHIPDRCKTTPNVNALLLRLRTSKPASQRSCPTSSGALSSETPAPLIANGNSPSYLPSCSYRPPRLVPTSLSGAARLNDRSDFFLWLRCVSARLSTGWAGFLFLPAVILPALLELHRREGIIVYKRCSTSHPSNIKNSTPYRFMADLYQMTWSTLIQVLHP